LSRIKDVCLEDFIEISNHFEVLDRQNVQNIVYWVISSSSILDNSLEKKLISCEFRFKNPKIYEIMFSLIQRYKMVKKNKEEFLKFLFRKSFKFIKNNFEEKNKGMFKKQLKRKFIDTYFIQEAGEIAKNNRIPSPFKKSYLVKRISYKLMKEILSNENFFKDFEVFLSTFKEFSRKERQRKIDKLTKQILLLIEKNNIEEIRNIQHLPWTEMWIEKCQLMGEEIVKNMKGSFFVKESKIV